MKRSAPLILWLFILLTRAFSSVGQETISPLAGYRALLNQPFDHIHATCRLLWDSISKMPPSKVRSVISALDADPRTQKAEDGPAKLALLKSIFSHNFSSLYEGQDWKYWGEKALSLAGQLDDDYLLQSCCLFLGDAYLRLNNYDTATFYLLKTVELSEKLGFRESFIVSNKIAVSNVLYRTHNYRQCLDFCLTNFDIESDFVPITVITDYNNCGLCYQKLGMPDSAIYYYNKVAAYAQKKQKGVWVGIALGNIGDAYQQKGELAKAMPYWQRDYDSSMKYNERDNAALTLAYMSAYEFRQGRRIPAIRQLQWATHVNRGDPLNLLRIDTINSRCYRALGLHDSADFFLDRHYRLLDSLNQVVSRNNYSLVEFRLAFEKNRYEYNLLKKERKAEVARRNLLIVALLASLLTGFFLYQRERLRARLAQQQTALAEAEKRSANEQLQTFTQLLLEKNEQIEKLNSSLEQQVQQNADELIHQTLLTESDWKRFKDLFDRTYPGFFSRLTNLSPGITASEMRLAALIRLRMGNKEMASMQGISLSSLRGNKTRLRQKLNMPADTDLDDFIKEL